MSLERDVQDVWLMPNLRLHVSVPMADKFDNASDLFRRSGVSFLTTAASILSASAVVSLALAPKSLACEAISSGCNVKWYEVKWDEKGFVFPLFSGGKLNFKGYEGENWYGGALNQGSFEITNFNKDSNHNTIDNHGTNPQFHGRLHGVFGVSAENSGSMKFTGTGDTRLYGRNDFLGTTHIHKGRLIIENTNAIPAGNIKIDSEATLKLKGNEIDIYTPVTSNNGRINFTGKNVEISSDIVSKQGSNSGALKLFVEDSLVDTIKPQITGDISGSGGISKTGGGSLVLEGDNTYSGSTSVYNGTLFVGDLLGNNGSLPKGNEVFVEGKNNAKIAFRNSKSEIGKLLGDGIVELDNSDTLKIGSGLAAGSDGQFNFKGTISDGKWLLWNESASLEKVGDGMAILSGNNTYTGTTTITSGILRVDGTLSDKTLVDVKPSGIYKVANDDTVDSITGSGNIHIFGGKTLGFGASSSEFKGVIRGDGGIKKVGSDSTTTLSGDNTFTGATSITAGTLKVSGSLAESTAVSVSSGAVYQVNSTDTIGSISGAGLIQIAGGKTLTAGGLGTDTKVSGVIFGGGNFTKDGTGTLSISSDNALSVLGGTATVKAGVIDFRRTSGVGSNQVISDLVVEKDAKVSSGYLFLGGLKNSGAIKVASLEGNDAANEFTNDGSIEITTSFDIDLKAGNDIFKTNSDLTFSGVLDGGAGDDLIEFGSSDNKLHPFRAAKITNFERAEQTSGTWDYDGNFKDSGIETMTLKGGVMEILDSEHATFKNFVMEGGQIVASLESKNSAPLTADSFDYKSGTLLIQAADQADPEGTYTVIDAPAASQGEMNELAAKSVLEYDNMNPEGFTGIGIKNGIKGSAIYDVFLKEGSLQLVVEQKHHADILDCLKDDSCDKPVAPGDDPHHHEIKPGRPGHDILTVILDDLLKELDLPVIGYGTLSRLTISGLAPRNIDGPGRGMATYNNLLTDTLFERLPLRQFDPVVIEETVVEEEEVIEEDPAPPVRGLWSKSGEVSDQDAQQTLDNAIAQNTDVVVEESTMVERLEAAGFVEDPSLTAQYARRDGVRAWFRAFGGDDRDSSSDNFHNPYYVNSGGGVLGVDVSVSESFQVGAFVNYGTINLIQQGALAGGGSWNPDGWGGGVRADYWTDNFYVQGLFSATGFSGNQKRDIVEITSQLGDETASGSKSATSYGLAFRVGTPFEAGDFLIEPQFTSTWSFNNENRFTESGAGDLNLTYKDRSTTYLQTDLAIKFAYPIKTGDTTELVPSLRVGWLGDWSGSLSNQTIGYRFTDDTVNIDSINEDTNGVLVEGGLDYTIANLNSSSYKVYVRGGIEAWGGTRGTDYRASGGFEWQF